MRHHLPLLALAAALLVPGHGLLAAQPTSQTAAQKAPERPGPPGPKAMNGAMVAMQAMEAAGTPGAQHAALARFAGDWSADIAIWMQAGGPAMKTQATARGEMVLGGRFLMMHHDGTLLGKPFHGMSLEGYDNTAKRFEGTWVDNFSTLITFSTGQCDDDACTSRTMTATTKDPISGQMVTSRSTTKWIDPDHFTYTSFMSVGDQEMKNMEIAYTRQK